MLAVVWRWRRSGAGRAGVRKRRIDLEVKKAVVQVLMGRYALPGGQARRGDGGWFYKGGVGLKIMPRIHGMESGFLIWH